MPPRSLFDRAAPGLLKMRREGKEQKKNLLLKQQAPFAKPLPTFAKPAAESGPDNPEWLISEDWALLQVSLGPALSRVSVGPSTPRGSEEPPQRADRCLTGPLGREAAAGAASEPHHRVPGPHAQLGPRQRRRQLLQPHLPLLQAVPQPLRERAHPPGGGQGEAGAAGQGGARRGGGWPALSGVGPEAGGAGTVLLGPGGAPCGCRRRACCAHSSSVLSLPWPPGWLMALRST